jgi:UDP-N-acetylglucosamine 2-epimerase (non-hydrolysing)
MHPLSGPKVTDKSVCFVVGARPNFMKVAPVYHALAAADPEVRLLLVHTGQHYDADMSAVFIDELGLPMPDVFLGVGSGSHAQQTADALVGIERVLVGARPSVVVVAGDVNSTLAGALAAAKLGIPVAHIEAGLRSFDETMPEETNRRLTDHVSRLLLAHSASAVENLEREGIDPKRIHLVGNTMIDSVLRHLPSALSREPWRRLGVEPGEFALLTLHRPALVDDNVVLRAAVEELRRLARATPLVFPVHPRTRRRLESSGVDIGALHSDGVVVTEPLGYLEFLGLEARAAFVVTDSGGVQEETSALGVRCFTLRETTERPITVDRGTNTVLGAQPERLRQIPKLLRAERAVQAIPYWDGEAGTRAAAILSAYVDAERPPAAPMARAAGSRSA